MSTLLEHGRTHDCGSLRAADVGARVVLFGWVHRRRDLGARIFVQLRDRFGITQIVFGRDLDAAAYEAATALKGEFCLAVQGTVVARGDNANAAMATGEIEIEAKRLGALAMQRLAGLDQVAYVRFASVYRDFTGIKDFEQFIARMRTEVEPEAAALQRSDADAAR